MTKYKTTLSRLLDSSGGQMVTQSSITAGGKVFVMQNDLSDKYNTDCIEKAGYALRAMMTQMKNYKMKDPVYINIALSPVCCRWNLFLFVYDAALIKTASIFKPLSFHPLYSLVSMSSICV